MFKKLVLEIFFFLLYLSSAFAINYFPDGYFESNDLTTITWAHAVNSKELLSHNLKNDSIQMLEADLAMGFLNNSTVLTVIMAHPPENVSDLSFDMFLNAVLDHNRNLTLKKRKGIKLDFKDYEAAEKSLPILNQFNLTSPALLQFPIWINADIFPGPVNASNNKVNATQFVNLQKAHLPRSTLSLGWTTRFGLQGNGEVITIGSYTKVHFDVMANFIKAEFQTETEKNNSQVTFPLRAAIAISSVENIKNLLDNSGINFSFPSVTLWEGSSDPLITDTQLKEFVEAIGAQRVFLDLPYSTRARSGGTVSQHNIAITFLMILLPFVLVKTM